MNDDGNDTLQLRIPTELKRELAVHAAKEGVTIRALILKSLASSGFKIASDEIRDKRKK